jgi:hypothetical protein
MSNVEAVAQFNSATRPRGEKEDGVVGLARIWLGAKADARLRVSIDKPSFPYGIT